MIPSTATTNRKRVEDTRRTDFVVKNTEGFSLTRSVFPFLHSFFYPSRDIAWTFEPRASSLATVATRFVTSRHFSRSVTEACVYYVHSAGLPRQSHHGWFRQGTQPGARLCSYASQTRTALCRVPRRSRKWNSSPTQKHRYSSVLGRCIQFLRRSRPHWHMG